MIDIIAVGLKAVDKIDILLFQDRHKEIENVDGNRLFIDLSNPRNIDPDFPDLIDCS